MRILICLDYPGYLRYFDSTIHALADNGHTVIVGFASLEQQKEGLEAVQDLGQVSVVQAPSKRKDVWEPLARGFRGAVDFVRYLHPRYADSPYLRERMAQRVPAWLKFLTRLGTLSPRRVHLMTAALLMLERAIPSDRDIERFIKTHRPDLFLISPLVTAAASQTDLLKSAKALRLRTGLLVASWDHLTSKGLIRIMPDRVYVWNSTQKAEAIELQRVPPSRIVVTGAQPWDHWFDREPRLTREEFLRAVGLRTDAPFVLFVGSTASISAPRAEIDFVHRWAGAIRASGDDRLRDMGILVRPHPFNLGDWQTEDISSFSNAVVYPRRSANPVNAHDRDDYFHSMLYASAVIGVNTSAMVEAAVVGRPVLTVLSPEFKDTQTGTLHFRYTLANNGGFLRSAPSLDLHVSQLVEVLDEPDVDGARRERFVTEFVRPLGRDRPATGELVRTIEALKEGPRPRRYRVPLLLLPVTLVLWPAALRLYFPLWVSRRAEHVRRRRIRSARRRLLHARGSLLRAYQTIHRLWRRLVRRLRRLLVRTHGALRFGLYRLRKRLRRHY